MKIYCQPKALLLSTLLMFIVNLSHADMCFEIVNGIKYYRPADDTPNISIFYPSKVANVKSCAPISTNDKCVQSAMAVCDQTWGGIKLYVNPTIPDSNNQNLYFRAISGTDDNGVTYYRRLQVYDATKATP